MEALTREETAVIAQLEASLPAMLDLLERIVNIESGSRNKGGVDAVGEVLSDYLIERGLTVERQRNADYGDIFVARSPTLPTAAKRPILFLAHRDTAFPDGEVARRPLHIAEGRAYGPGVSDMKAGAVMLAFVLAALVSNNAHPAPLVGLFTGDEEIGSPSSRVTIGQHGAAAQAAFNCEPGRAPNLIVHGRKGGMVVEARLFGRAAHSGANIADGVSAIGELAACVLALHQLTDPDRGVSVNVGLIRGGEAANTVAPSASAVVDIRYLDAADRQGIIDRINDIVCGNRSAGAGGEVEIRYEFLPLLRTESSDRLFRLYQACAHDIGFEVGSTFTGACSDSGFVAAAGCPVLCGTGPVGGLWHTPAEFMEISTFLDRAKALALCVMRLDTVT